MMACEPGERGKYADLLEINETMEVIEHNGREVLVTDYNGLKGLFEKRDGITYVVNFWASWCRPCIKELPYFQELQQNHEPSELRVVLVSLDFRNQAEAVLIPFLEERFITLPVILLNDPAANDWIDRIDPSWSGSIPATLIFRDDRREFYEREFTGEELNSIVQQFIK